MSAEVLYEAMGLKGYSVEGAWEDEGSIRVQVAVPRESISCGQCGCRRVHVHERARREWKSAPIGTTQVVITMDSPKVKCLRCHSKTWHQPIFANGQRRVTKAFEKTLQTWLSKRGSGVAPVESLFAISYPSWSSHPYTQVLGARAL